METRVNDRVNEKVNERQRVIISSVSSNPRITQVELVTMLGISKVGSRVSRDRKCENRRSRCRNHPGNRPEK